MIPVGYARVNIVADSYRLVSIKDVTRLERGKSYNSEKVIIKSEKSKVPPDFNRFLSDGSNKTRMIELVFHVIEKNKAKF